MSTPRLLGMLCVRNEADRYLTESLAWHMSFLDDVLVYDDRSTDETVELAENQAAIVVVREQGDPSFLQHEGQFRENAWHALEQQLFPAAKDWIFAFDADEFLMHPSSTDPRWLLQGAAELSTEHRVAGYRFRVREVFDVDDAGCPQIRTDGYWDDIHATRFFQYREGGRWANRRMACGSTPTYVEDVADCTALELLHFGYARKDDRVDKHNRYYGVPGHSAQHIESIISTPTLVPWTGAVPF